MPDIKTEHIDIVDIIDKFVFNPVNDFLHY